MITCNYEPFQDLVAEASKWWLGHFENNVQNLSIDLMVWYVKKFDIMKMNCIEDVWWIGNIL